MGPGAAVERHDGTPPGEDEIAARMRAGGLSPHGWGNGPGDAYGWHEHGYEKVLYCVRGQIVFHTAGGDIELGPGDRWCSRHTPRTRQRSARTACAASKRPASEETVKRTAAGEGVCFQFRGALPVAASQTSAAHRLPRSAAVPSRYDY